MKPIYDQWGVVITLHDQKRKSAGYSPIPIGKRMDLHEAMMQPGSFDQRMDFADLELFIPRTKVVNFRIDVLGRAVLEQRTVRSYNMIYPLLPLAT